MLNLTTTEDQPTRNKVNTLYVCCFLVVSDEKSFPKPSSHHLHEEERVFGLLVWLHEEQDREDQNRRVDAGEDAASVRRGSERF